jgi:spore coat protein A
MSISRRDFVKWSAAAGTWVYVSGVSGSTFLQNAFATGALDPLAVPKWRAPLLIPPVMPKAGVVKQKNGKYADYYEISMKQISQQILPAGFPQTTVWGYGAVKAADKRGLLLHNAPSLTIEASYDRPVRVKWINDLKDEQGNYRPHLLPVDPTLHWANPAGGTAGRDTRPTFETTPERYTGPVPMVTHVHGAVGVQDDSDGYAEAWYLPDAADIPAEYADVGTWYDFFSGKAGARYGVTWGPGHAVFQYPNLNRASTIWYHDHALGMTRLNVYAGPAGFYIVRGGPAGDAAVRDSRRGGRAILPGPAPSAFDPYLPKHDYYEIPVAIQDRAFNADGSLFYPESRESFDGYTGPYIPGSDVSPVWNPEFFGNTIMVNGAVWPFQKVQKRRYRLRFLNGCDARYLILDFSAIPGVEAWQIGNEGGFLAVPVNITGTLGSRLLMSPAERADVIVDFTNVPVGDYVLGNVGPDEPFGGGVPGTDFDAADPTTTGQLLQFRVVPRVGWDLSTPPRYLRLPGIVPLPAATVTRPLLLAEEMSMTWDGPVEAKLGTVEGDPNTAPGMFVRRTWMEDVTENPAVGATEVWEFYNTTADAHPMHVHEVTFEVVDRQAIDIDMAAETVQVTPGSVPRPPEAWETGFKDTVTAYPGEVTRVRAQFKTPGQFVWHCHIVEHEDNEMMRPFRIGPAQPGQAPPGGGGVGGL